MTKNNTKMTSIIAITFFAALMLVPSGMNAHAEVIYTQDDESGTQVTNGGGTQGFGADIGTGHNLIGETVNSITLDLKKNNSPTGTMTIGVWESGNDDATQPDYIFGTQDVTLLNSTYGTYTFTSSDASGITLAEDDLVGWFSGTANAVASKDSTTNVDTNIIARTVNSSATWNSSGDDNQDPAMILEFIESGSTNDDLQNQITSLNSTIIQQALQITDLQNGIISLNATIQDQQEDIDYLYEIWEDIRDTIITWLTGRP